MTHDVKFRLPDYLYKRVQEFATVDRRSLSNAIVFMLGRALDEWDNVTENEHAIQQNVTLAPNTANIPPEKNPPPDPDRNGLPPGHRYYGLTGDALMDAMDATAREDP